LSGFGLTHDASRSQRASSWIVASGTPQHEMKFRFVWVGKTKEPNLLTLQNEYFSRLSRFVRTEVTEVREGRTDDRPREEGEAILQALAPGSFAVALDAEGKQMTSYQLAAEIEKWMNSSKRDVVFIIGGAEGLSSAVAERADIRLSLSFLTFTHEMVRVFLLEQLYRAFTIIRGYPYQK